MTDVAASGNFNFKVYADGVRRRTRLPVTEPECKKPAYNVFAFLRKMFIGMDVARIGLPIACYNPTSYVQREACMVQHADFLRKASSLDDPVSRLEYVAAFLISSLSDIVSDCYRRQPFSGVIGETFEFQRPDLGFRMVSETTAFSPPGNSTFAESVNIRGEPDAVYRVSISGNVEKAIFHGRTVEIKLGKCWTIELPQRKEAFVATSINHCSLIVSNFWKGGWSTMKIRVDGHVDIACKSMEKSGNNHNKLKCVLQFHPPSNGFDWFAGWNQNVDPAYSDGYIEDINSGERIVSFYGNYYEEYYSVPTKAWSQAGGWRKAWSSSSRKNTERPFDLGIPGQKLLWRKPSFLEPQPDYFMMNEFHIQLNEMTPELVKTIPPTDSRFRKDVRLFESGRLHQADEVKRATEEDELFSRRRRITAAGGGRDPWKPLWFNLIPNPYDPIQDVWMFNGQYWKRDWNKCPKIVGFSDEIEI